MIEYIVKKTATPIVGEENYKLELDRCAFDGDGNLKSVGPKFWRDSVPPNVIDAFQKLKTLENEGGEYYKLVIDKAQPDGYRLADIKWVQLNGVKRRIWLCRSCWKIEHGGNLGEHKKSEKCGRGVNKRQRYEEQASEMDNTPTVVPIDDEVEELLQRITAAPLLDAQSPEMWLHHPRITFSYISNRTRKPAQASGYQTTWEELKRKCKRDGRPLDGSIARESNTGKEFEMHNCAYYKTDSDTGPQLFAVGFTEGDVMRVCYHEEKEDQWYVYGTGKILWNE